MNRLTVASTFLILFCSQISVAQEAQVLAINNDQPNPIEEITVIGQKHIKILRDQIDAAQDRIIDAYNELNTEKEYEIHCLMVAPLGTKITKKNCAPNYYHTANANVANATVQRLQGSKYSTLTPAASSILVVKNRILREKMLEYAKTDAGFLTAVEDLNVLEEQLKNRREEYFNKKDN